MEIKAKREGEWQTVDIRQEEEEEEQEYEESEK